MKRKLPPLAIAALTGTLGLGTTPLWADGNSGHGQYQNQTMMEQSPKAGDQNEMNSNSSGTAASEMNSNKIEKAQQALKQQGYDPGSIDGTLNPQTQAAIQSFQQSSGLETTGRLDDQTLARLGVDEHSSQQRSVNRGNSADSGNFSTSGSSDSERASPNSAEIPPKY